MTWVKLDDGFPEHPKIDGLTDGAFRLHVAGLCYSNRNLTDGRIPDHVARRLTPRFKPTQLDELVKANVWEIHPDDGFQIHDYLDYQPSRDAVLAEREKRSAAGRKGADARWNKHGGRTTS